ncbi:hypothetical protein A2U01_0103474, partial [Trifolium medium]|nr:hypothetical protein [Trifolium medium]
MLRIAARWQKKYKTACSQQKHRITMILIV